MIEYHLAVLLDTEITGLTYEPADVGGNVTVAWQPDDGLALAVAVMPTGGRAQPTRQPDDYPSVQIIVRGAPQDSYTPRRVAQEIHDLLNCRPGQWELDGGVTPDGTTIDPVLVMGVTALQSTPVPLGRDALDRHEYVVNLDFMVSHPTAHRP